MPKPTFFNLDPAKRDRIVQLAIEEFASHPFRAASISRIVKNAGIAKGSFYQYFDDKRDLYQWLVLEHIAEAKMRFIAESAPAPDDDFFTALEKLMRAGMRFGLSHPRLARVAGWILQAPPDRAAGRLEQHFRQVRHRNLRSLVVRGQEAGHLRADVDPDAAADLLVGVLHEGLNSATYRRLGVDLIELCATPELAKKLGDDELDELIHGLVDVLRHGLAAENPPEGGAGELFDVRKYFPVEPPR